MKVHPKTVETYNNLSLKKVLFITHVLESFGIEITEPLLNCLIESIRKVQNEAVKIDCISDETVKRLECLNRK